jgi:hypothetical protein
MGFKKDTGVDSHGGRYRYACQRVPRKSVPPDASLLQGADAAPGPGQLGKITLPFRLASNKTHRAIAVFRAGGGQRGTCTPDKLHGCLNWGFSG